MWAKEGRQNQKRKNKRDVWMEEGIVRRAGEGALRWFGHM